MRFIAASLIAMLCLFGEISAQEKDTINMVKTAKSSLTLPMHPDYESNPVFQQGSDQGIALRTPVLQAMNFNPNIGWRIESGSLFGIRSLNSFPFGNRLNLFYSQSVWDYYLEIYGIRTYLVNNKFFVGTAGFSDKYFNEYSHKPEIYRQTNYSSSLFVGYKFSEKFSISASFTIQRNNDPLNRFQPIPNSGIFP